MHLTNLKINRVEPTTPQNKTFQTIEESKLILQIKLRNNKILKFIDIKVMIDLCTMTKRLERNGEFLPRTKKGKDLSIMSFNREISTLTDS